MSDNRFKMERKEENVPDSAEDTLKSAIPTDLPSKIPSHRPTDLPLPNHRPGEPLMYDLPGRGDGQSNYTELF